MKRSIVSGDSASRAGQDAHKKAPSSGYSVLTVFGNCLLDSRSKVLVKDGERFLRIPVSELRPEQEVLFAKEGIEDIRLDSINDALMQSARYASTMPILFRALPDGSFTTAFRYALLEGLLSHSSSWPLYLQGLEPAEGSPLPRLSPLQLDSASAFIHMTLRSSGILSAGQTHIRNGWLCGHVIAPLNRQEVARTLLPLAGGLRGLLSGDFEDAYRLYVNIRKQAMRSISLVLRGGPAQGQGPAPRPEGGLPGEGRSGFSARPELRLIADHFASQVSLRYALARVVNVSMFERDGSSGPSPRGVMFKGIVTGMPDDGSLLVHEGPGEERIPDPEDGAAPLSPKPEDARGARLIESVQRGDLALVSEHLGKGAPIDHRDEKGRTPLMLAILRRSEGIAKLLILNRADICAEDPAGDTPLILATRTRQLVLMDAILRKGADPEHRNKQGLKASDEAKGDKRMLDLLGRYYVRKEEKGAEMADASRSDAKEGFLMAVNRGDLERILELLEGGADPDQKTKGGKLPLTIAVLGDRAALVRFFLESGADADSKDKDGMTALMYAAKEFKHKMARMLLDHGASVDIRNERGETALILAVKRNHIECIEMLLAHGADPTIAGFQGSAIDIASTKAKRGHLAPMLREAAERLGTNSKGLA